MELPNVILFEIHIDELLALATSTEIATTIRAMTIYLVGWEILRTVVTPCHAFRHLLYKTISMKVQLHRQCYIGLRVKGSRELTICYCFSLILYFVKSTAMMVFLLLIIALPLIDFVRNIFEKTSYLQPVALTTAYLSAHLDAK